MSSDLPTRLRTLRGSLRRKEMAPKLGLPLSTYIKYEIGKRTPNALALAELERRMAQFQQKES